MTDPMEPWERKEGETDRAWEAFAAYRDLGPGRSIDAAFRALQERQNRGKRAAGKKRAAGRTSAGRHRAPRHWETWSKDHGWTKRAAAWDAHLDLLSRRAREAEHRGELDAFRRRQRDLAEQAQQGAMQLLELCNRTLEELAKRDGAVIPAKLLPSYLRAAGVIARAATDSEAQALAVEQLLGEFMEDD